MATSSTLRDFESNKSGKISSARSSHQVAGTQVEVLKIVPEGTASRIVTGAPAEAPAIKELKEHVDAAEDDFKIDLDYSPGQRVTELSDSDKKSLSSTHGDGMSGLYTTISPPQNRLDKRLDFAEEEEAHLQRLEKKRYQAEVWARILRMKKEKSRGFALKDAPTELGSSRPQFDKDALALKRAKETKRPNVYTDQSQKHLDRYFRQVELTFWSKPTIYASKKDKCVYAGEYLGETPTDD